METLQILIAVCVTAALAGVLWRIRTAFLGGLCRERERREGFLIRGISEPAQLENAVRCAKWQRSRRGINEDIVIVDDGLDGETLRMAEIFGASRDNIRVIKNNSEQ